MEECCISLGSKEPNSSPAKPLTKLCLICCGCRRGVISDRSYYVFILDPSQNSDAASGFIPRVPDLMFEGLGSMSFCALNSSLYMFESFDSSKRNKERKSVYTCDLSAFLSEENEKESNLNSTLKNNSNSVLQLAPCMHGVKEKSAAVVTPRGQILVFSRRIYFDSRPERVDFELYDPVTKSWRVLPRLCPPWLQDVDNDTFRITAYSFLSESLFCVVTIHGTFALDLDHDQEFQQWNIVKIRSLGWNDYSSRQFFVIDDEMYLTLDGVRRRGDGYRLFNFPPAWTPEFDHTFHDMSLINVSSNQELRFCNVQSMFNHKTVFYTTVNVWCCDLAKYGRDKAEMKKGCRLSATGNTLKFVPKVEEVLDCFFPCTIFPFGEDSLCAYTPNSSL